jgi:hypothetical protein
MPGARRMGARLWKIPVGLATAAGAWYAFTQEPPIPALLRWVKSWDFPMLSYFNWEWFVLMVVGLTILVRDTPWAKRLVKYVSGSRAVMLGSTPTETVVVLSEAQAKDVLNHIKVDEFLCPRAKFAEDLTRKPMGYPLVVRNGRPFPAQIIAYEITVRDANDTFHQTVTWHAPDGHTNNDFEPSLPPYQAFPPSGPKLGGLPQPVEGINVPTDGPTIVPIPVDIHEIAKEQEANPWWSASGTLLLRCGKIEETRSFQDIARRHQLAAEDWQRARSAFAS